MARKRKHSALNLNDPKDAMRFLLSWAVSGKLTFEDPLDVFDYTDKEIIGLAKEVFLNADQTPAGTH